MHPATVSDAMGLRLGAEAGGWLRLQWGCADVGTVEWHHLALGLMGSEYKLFL